MSAQTNKIVFVSGANQGLGFEVIHVTALREPSSIYVLGSRNLESGREAVNKLRELGVKAEIDVVELDVTNDDQVIAAVKHIETKYGKLDGKSVPCQNYTVECSKSSSVHSAADTASSC